VSTLDEQIIKNYPFIDAVVVGEGENTVLEIVKNVPFENITGLSWRRDGEFVRNPPRALQPEINEFDYDNRLLAEKLEDWKDYEVSDDLLKLKAFPVITSRGCPYHCAFCAANQQWASKYRNLSPELMIDKIRGLVNDYGIRYFRFYDALFIGNEKKILKFCDLLEASGLEIHFRIDIRVGTSRQLLERLRKVGCDVVGFGVESGSDRILKRINKETSREKIEETIAICKELGFWIIGFFMLSLPDETCGDIKKTFELFKDCDRFNVQFNKIHPNTAFYNELKERKEISDDIWLDPAKGYNTIYGNEIFYCKELFPSANFFLAEINVFIIYSNHIQTLARSSQLIHENGLLKGGIHVLKSMVFAALLRFSAGRSLYLRLRKKSLTSDMYRKFEPVC